MSVSYPFRRKPFGLSQCYLKTERPLTNAPEVFVSLKGRARGTPMTPAGLRSLFRHHRKVTGVQKANPHRFRHTFGSDMIRAGVSLPALQRLMGHASYSHHPGLHSFDAAGCVRRVRARRRAHRQTETTAAGMRKPPHPLEEASARARAAAGHNAASLNREAVPTHGAAVHALPARIFSRGPAAQPTAARSAHARLVRVSVGAARKLLRQTVVQTVLAAACLIRLRKLFDLLADSCLSAAAGPGVEAGYSAARSGLASSA